MTASQVSRNEAAYKAALAWRDRYQAVDPTDRRATQLRHELRYRLAQSYWEGE